MLVRGTKNQPLQKRIRALALRIRAMATGAFTLCSNENKTQLALKKARSPFVESDQFPSDAAQKKAQPRQTPQQKL